MEPTISELYLLIRKNKDWLELNSARRNSVYYQMVENTLRDLEETLDFMEKFAEVEA